ncbi:cyclase family protein [Amycolatopsis rhabdoformis]|uniref:Cyclase family protein n=1 Tax=Amycolatopsis rhabdoformis TaxID=1448059 RepID=A0ABZ1ID05_9PSEU|nr:cyclase family protein [Amycolatopsis rhabdoformis]WSE31616.1 cyclase family protein [Amycolatopsis rhabdoformis]
MAKADAIPDYDDLPTKGGLPCSWGLWGPDDKLGCLNLITEDHAAEAARTVKRGAVFSLNWRMDLPNPAFFGRPNLRHEIVKSTTSTSLNDVLHDWNTQASSQWDGFRHVERVGFGNYNGIPSEEHGVHVWAERGIFGHAVLADVGRYRERLGRPLDYRAADPIEVEDLVGTLESQRVEVHSGDILLVRTGWTQWYESLTAAERAEIAPIPALRTPGLRPVEDMVRTLWNLRLAAVAADNPALEIWPPGALLEPGAEADAIKADPARRHEMMLHPRLIPMLGMPIGEMWDLGRLAEDCARDGVYRFLLASAPINLQHGAASPANALAVK